MKTLRNSGNGLKLDTDNEKVSVLLNSKKALRISNETDLNNLNSIYLQQNSDLLSQWQLKAEVIVGKCWQKCDKWESSTRTSSPYKHHQELQRTSSESTNKILNISTAHGWSLKINFLTKCIAELRGGCGSIKSWEGVWPKLRIWLSIA